MTRVLFSTSALVMAVTAMPSMGQLFTDTVGDASKYTVVGDGDSGTTDDVRFGFNYGSFDIFGDGFITGGIGEAPNSSGGAATTGIFMTANNASFGTPVSLFTGAVANGINVGAGTATPNYVLRFDAFNSVTPGIDGALPGSATNYQWAGINYTGTPTAGGTWDYAGPFGTGSAGQTFSITGDGDSGDDYETTIGDITIEGDIEGYNGLITYAINEAFRANGFDPDGTTAPPSALQGGGENNNFVSPIPGAEATFDVTDETTYQRIWHDLYAPTTDPLHYNSALNDNGNDLLRGGTPANRWVEHEIYYVDGIWTYVMDGVPVVQIDPALSGDESQIVTDAGTFALGFLDGFSSVNEQPEGSNFVIYDNISLDAAASGDVPDQLAWLATAGYIPGATNPGITGDYNDSGQVEQGDLDLVLQNWGLDTDIAGIPSGWTNDLPLGQIEQTELDGVLSNWGSTMAPDFSGSNVPEPTSVAILAGLGAIALRRRSA